MSDPIRGVTLTFEDIRSSVCSALSLITQKVNKKVCSYFNVIALTLELVTKYCKRNKEIELWYRPLPDSMRGLTICEQGTFIVVCNDKEKEPKVRLKVILHELGHYLLHRDFLENGNCTRAGNEWFADQFEKEANLYALMGMVPDAQVRTVCNEHKELESSVQCLEDTYAFTTEEAVVRIAAYDAELRKNSYQGMWDLFIGNSD